MNNYSSYYNNNQLTRIIESRSRNKLVEHLRSSFSCEARELAHRMDRCGDTRATSDNRVYCRQPACPRCKRAYARQQARSVQDMMAGASRDALSFVTILFGVPGCASHVPATWKKGREALHNRIKAMRGMSDRWDSVQLVGWMEADPFEAQQVPLMQSRMRTYLDANGPILFGEETGWIVHAHLIVHHPRLDWQQVRDAFMCQWKEEHAVDVQPFQQKKYSGQTTDIGLFATTCYALKSTVGRMLFGDSGKAIDVHPASWLADLHTALYAEAKGFKSWRVKINAACPSSEVTLVHGDGGHLLDGPSAYSADDIMDHAWLTNDLDELFASLL